MQNSIEQTHVTERNKKEVIVATVSRKILISLTILAVVLDQFSIERYLLLALVFIITVVKGKIVVDVFMGLLTAPKLWRRLLTSYVLVVPMVTGLLYFFS